MKQNRLALVAAIASENLEPRRLLARLVEGSAGADVISVSHDGAALVVTIDDVAHRVAEHDDVIIAAGAGDDTLTIEDGGGWNITLDGGDGDDAFAIGVGSLDASNLGRVSVVGGAGVDALTLNDGLAAAAGAIAIDNPFDTYTAVDIAGARIEIDGSNDQAAVESLTLRLGDLNDAVTVRGTNARTPISVLGLAGDDTLTFADDVDSNLRGALWFDGGEGTNKLVVDDSADAFHDDYVLGGDNAVGTLRKSSGGAAIGYTGVNSLNLLAGAADAFVGNNQRFQIDSLPAGTAATIFAGAGDDLLTFGDGITSLDQLDGAIAFAGQGGVDRIVYDDAAGTENSNIELSPSAIRKAGTGLLIYFECEVIDVRAGAGDNVLRVTATIGDLNVTLSGGGGDDVFHVGGGDIDGNIASAVSITGGAGSDALFIDDSDDDRSGGDGVYTIDDGVLLRTLKAVLWSSDDLDAVEHVSLSGSANADALRVRGATANVRLHLDSGGGDDLIEIWRTSGPNELAGTVLVASGDGRDTLELNGDYAAADTAVTLAESVERLESLRIRSGGRLSLGEGRDALLVVDGELDLTGTLDVGRGTLVAPEQTYEALVALASAGYDAGWAVSDSNSARLASSIAASSARIDGVAVVRAASVANLVLPGYSPNASDVIVRYALGGDTNLDDEVEFGDLLALAQRYGLSDPTFGWAQGTFDYDVPPTIDFDDLLVLSQNFGAVLSLLVPSSARSAS